MYHMKIIFGIDASLSAMKQICAMTNTPPSIMHNVYEVAIEQTVPFVPTQEHLNQYANAIRENYAKNAQKSTAGGYLVIEDVHFLRYELFEELENSMTLLRARQIAFCALQLIRQEREKKGHDPVDTDDWLFSELDMEKQEVADLFGTYGVYPYTGSCFDNGDSPKNYDTVHFSPQKKG